MGDIEEAFSIYSEFQAKALKGEETNFASFDDDEFLFCASITPSSRLNASALDIGYWVSSKYEGKRLGTLAAKVLML